MPDRYVNTKALGRRIGDLGKPDMPDFDGDGDGFVTNPATGEDDLPAPHSAVKKFADGIPEHLERFRDAYDQDPLDGDGDCYKAALKLQQKLWREEEDPEKRKNIKLVHGIPLGTGGEVEGLRYGHAWVEVTEPLDKDSIQEQLANVSDSSREQMRRMLEDPHYRTTVYDHSNGKELELPRVLYYAYGNIEPEQTRYYTFEETVSKSAETGHYGPWE